MNMCDCQLLYYQPYGCRICYVGMCAKCSSSPLVKLMSNRCYLFRLCKICIRVIHMCTKRINCIGVAIFKNKITIQIAHSNYMYFPTLITRIKFIL